MTGEVHVGSRVGHRIRHGLLVEVISTAINHMDAFLRNGKEDTWHDDPWPRRSTAARG